MEGVVFLAWSYRNSKLIYLKREIIVMFGGLCEYILNCSSSIFVKRIMILKNCE
jgi:hypothetical protein